MGTRGSRFATIALLALAVLPVAGCGSSAVHGTSVSASGHAVGDQTPPPAPAITPHLLGGASDQSASTTVLASGVPPLTSPAPASPASAASPASPVAPATPVVSANPVDVGGPTPAPAAGVPGKPVDPAVPVGPPTPRVTDPAPATAAGAVPIDAAASGDPAVLLSDLIGLGLTRGAIAGRLVSGMLPSSSLAAAQKLPSAVYVQVSQSQGNS